MANLKSKQPIIWLKQAFCWVCVHELYIYAVLLVVCIMHYGVAFVTIKAS